MVIQIKRQIFDSLEDEMVGAASFQPMLLVYKNKIAEQTEQDHYAVKSQFYRQLTGGQQALFTFYVYHNHAWKSPVEFYWWTAYFLAQPEIWSAIKGGLQYFEADSMLNLLEETEGLLKVKDYPRSLEDFSVSREDVDTNEELLTAIRSLHAAYRELTPATLKMVGEHIRNNPNEFVDFID
jgi:hypothetical protein